MDRPLLDGRADHVTGGAQGRLRHAGRLQAVRGALRRRLCGRRTIGQGPTVEPVRHRRLPGRFGRPGSDRRAARLVAGGRPGARPAEGGDGCSRADRTRKGLWPEAAGPPKQGRGVEAGGELQRHAQPAAGRIRGAAPIRRRRLARAAHAADDDPGQRRAAGSPSSRRRGCARRGSRGHWRGERTHGKAGRSIAHTRPRGLWPAARAESGGPEASRGRGMPPGSDRASPGRADRQHDGSLGER